MNILYVINFNSIQQCKNLLLKSDLNALDIKTVVIYSNGIPPNSDDIEELYYIAKKINFDIIFNQKNNNGYGAAINDCIENTFIYYSNHKYAFFSNADLFFKCDKNNYPYELSDIVGFPLYENNNYIISRINIFTPLIPFNFRKIIGSSKPDYGSSDMVHGCFFGIKINFLSKVNKLFCEDYFLYWEETRFFYELTRSGHQSFVSDAVRIDHWGAKAVKGDDARYYLLRNGLHFYKRIVKSNTLFFAWFFINSLYAIYLLLKVKKFPSWYHQGALDFRKKQFGRRIISK